MNRRDRRRDRRLLDQTPDTADDHLGPDPCTLALLFLDGLLLND